MSALSTEHPLSAEHPLHGLSECAYLLVARGWSAAGSSGASSSDAGSSAAGSSAPPHTPVWFQRQAGRSLPEYRALRASASAGGGASASGSASASGGAGGSILEAIKNPELAAELTLQPVRRYGVDAAILFSDIIVPAAAVGFGVEIKPGVGPVAEQPFDRRADLDRLPPLEPEQHVPYVAEAVKLATGLLASEGLNVPLIGFAGAPFTVASYLIEGKPARDLARTKQLMLNDPALWHDLMARLADLAISSLRAQVMAGASAAQMFDTWAGALSPYDYAEFVLPHSQRVFEALADFAAVGVPRAHFGVSTGELLGLMASVDCEIVGVDWRVPLEVAAQKVAVGRTQAGAVPASPVPARLPVLQGNLDPTVCLAEWPAVRERVDQILASAAAAGNTAAGNTAAGDTAPGHIFNLGHGVLPMTDPAILEQVVRYVHTQTAPGGEFDLAHNGKTR